MRLVCQLMVFILHYLLILSKKKLIDLIEENDLFTLLVMIEMLSSRLKRIWSCQTVCEALIFLLDTIYIRFALSYMYTNKL